MATVENGDTVEGLQDKANGNITSAPKSNRQVNPARWMFGIIARLLIWYAILTPFLYCPSNLSALGDHSSRICKPYLITRSYIEPHVSPIYQSYAGPYVDIAKPYYDQFNEKIYTPTAKFTRYNYALYGAPRIEKAWQYGVEQWEIFAVPRLQLARDTAAEFYDTSIEPHKRNLVSTITPYYTIARERAEHLHTTYILPSYLQTKPFVIKAYDSGRDVLAGTVFPYIQKVWSFVLAFMDTTVLPRVTGLYSQNVEPQLIRISEKLASYREGRKLREVVDEVDSSMEASISSTAVPETFSQMSSLKGGKTTEEYASTTSLTPDQQKEQAQEKIAMDLKTWQEKFSVAADRGSDDLRERIQEIVESQLESGAPTYGESLVQALEKTAEGEIEGLKARINEIVGSLPNACATQDEEDAQGELLDAVRSSGIVIREKAHKLREWFNDYDAELVRRASVASDSTLEVLDGIRNLGLQEIGMRWAWMDGVTYKDWAKYHALKKQFAEWRKDVRDVGMEHEDLKHARSLGSDILSTGMSVAESVAKELSRLKGIGKWKIEARDDSNDFTDHTVAASSVRAEKGIPPCSVKEAHSTESQLPPTASDSVDSDRTEQGDRGDYVDEMKREEQFSDPNSVLGGAAAQTMSDHGSPDNFEERPGTAFTTAEPTTPELTTTSTSGALEHISSIASSRLQEGLSLASAEFSNAKAAVSASADPGNQQFLMDAQRRYYEALGMAHDKYSIFMDSASEAVFATTTEADEGLAPTEETSMPNYQDLVGEAQSEFSTLSSLLSRSSRGVVVSASSAISSLGEEEAQSIISEASSKHETALSAASASLTSALSAASAASNSASSEISVPSRGDDVHHWEVLVSKASQSVYAMPTPSEAAQAEAAVESSALAPDTEDGSEPDEAESETSSSSLVQDSASVEQPASSTGNGASEPTASVSTEAEADTDTEAFAAVETLLCSASDAVDSIIDLEKAHVTESSDSGNGAEFERAEDDVTSKIDAVLSSAETAVSSAIYEQETQAIDSTFDAAESSATENQKNSAFESAHSQLEEIVEKAQARLDEETTEGNPDPSEAVTPSTATANDEFTSDTTTPSAETDTARGEL